ncbi:hypothetical protein [Actinoplanes sp. M2I2]|uniref:hypothetical protein n=1 Tax=Actinoplanes sp. M2I2 TaxID=1734444 RepID=UPI00201FF45F|nr:hypothetical protein [Actinoplanes sp. M2I2]
MAIGTRRSVLRALPVLLVMVLALFGATQGLAVPGVAGSVRSCAATAAQHAVASSATAPADVEPDRPTASPAPAEPGAADRSVALSDQFLAVVRSSRAPPPAVA